MGIHPPGLELFLMLLKSYILFPKISDLFIYIYFFLGHLRHIKDESLINSTRNKFQPHITFFTKYLTIYNN